MSIQGRNVTGGDVFLRQSIGRRQQAGKRNFEQCLDTVPMDSYTAIKRTPFGGRCRKGGEQESTESQSLLRGMRGSEHP